MVIFVIVWFIVDLFVSDLVRVSVLSTFKFDAV